MVDLIKKAIYTGVGLAVLTKEKAEELVKELSQQAKLSEQEGKELFDSLLKQSEHARPMSRNAAIQTSQSTGDRQ